MMTFDERVTALVSLPLPARLAFAAGCAERGLAEAQRHCPTKLAEYPALREALDLVWRQAISQDIDYNKDVMAVHDAAAQLIPMSEEDPVPDKALLYASKAVCLAMAIMAEPEESPKLAALAGGAMVNLVGVVYEDLARVQTEEREWQTRAIELLMAHGARPITRAMFDGNPEYERGAVSDKYKSGIDE